MFWCVNREIVLLSPSQCLTVHVEGPLKGSLKRQVACLQIIFFIFIFWVLFERGYVLFFWQYLIASYRTPDGGENISSEILDWLFKPTSLVFVSGNHWEVITAFSKAESFLECLTVWSGLDQWKSLAILPSNLLVGFPLKWLKSYFMWMSTFCRNTSVIQKQHLGLESQKAVILLHDINTF